MSAGAGTAAFAFGGSWLVIVGLIVLAAFSAWAMTAVRNDLARERAALEERVAVATAEAEDRAEALRRSRAAFQASLRQAQ